MRPVLTSHRTTFPWFPAANHRLSFQGHLRHRWLQRKMNRPDRFAVAGPPQADRPQLSAPGQPDAVGRESQTPNRWLGDPQSMQHSAGCHLVQIGGAVVPATGQQVRSRGKHRVEHGGRVSRDPCPYLSIMQAAYQQRPLPIGRCCQAALTRDVQATIGEAVDFRPSNCRKGSKRIRRSSSEAVSTACPPWLKTTERSAILRVNR